MLFVIIIFNNVHTNDIFSEDKSDSHFIENNSLNKDKNSNQSLLNAQPNNYKHYYLYIDTGGLSIPIGFFALEKNMFNNVIYDKENNSITLILNPSIFNHSNLVIQIPRSVMDSKTPENKDRNFTVLVDGKPSKFSEITPEKQTKNNLSTSTPY